MIETAESRRIMQLEAQVIDLMEEIKEVRGEADEYRRVIKVISAWGYLLQTNMEAALNLGEMND